MRVVHVTGKKTMEKAVNTRVMGTVTAGRMEMLPEMHAAGLQGVRINSAHVTPETLAGLIKSVRAIDPDITILVDTKGPEIRTTDLMPGLESIFLAEGTAITVSGHPGETTEGRIHVNCIGLGLTLTPQDTLSIDDGSILLGVTEVIDEDSLLCQVKSGGELGPRKGVSASPGARLPYLPPVTARDMVNIKAAVEAGADIIAHSFVRTAEDVAAVRDVIASSSCSSIKLYAKIETREALENLCPIAEAADGLLIARGDLGAQIDPAEIPAAQARIAATARSLGKPFIIATQILGSMMHSPLPSRTDGSDIALGVLQGASWLLLTGETAMGEYPVEAVRFMSRTIESFTGYLAAYGQGD